MSISRAPDHLEFKRGHSHAAGRALTQDDLLVPYEPDSEAWRTAVGRIRAVGFEPVPASNPWWDERGATFEDPDGYRVVLWQGAWIA